MAKSGSALPLQSCPNSIYLSTVSMLISRMIQTEYERNHKAPPHNCFLMHRKVLKYEAGSDLSTDERYSDGTPLGGAERNTFICSGWMLNVSIVQAFSGEMRRISCSTNIASLPTNDFIEVYISTIDSYPLFRYHICSIIGVGKRKHLLLDASSFKRVCQGP